MIKRIVVLLSGTRSDQAASQAAVLIAKRVGAGVEGLSIKVDPTEIMFRLGEGVAASSVDEIIKAAEKNSDEAAARGYATLEAVAKDAGLEMLRSLPQAAAPSVYAHTVQGPTMDVLTAQIGLADLAVFGEPDGDGPIDLAMRIEHTMMHLRRPVLIARGNIVPTLGDKVLVPFNGTVEASAALSRAAPILVKARSIEILHLAERAGDAGIAMNAQRYLLQYGAASTIVEQAPSGKGIGEDIAARAAATGADLIVMGAYGRSRLRELVLGGATRYMMHHAPVPVFLAH